jgi:hypothetical protein
MLQGLAAFKPHTINRVELKNTLWKFAVFGISCGIYEVHEYWAFESTVYAVHSHTGAWLY